MSDMDVSAPCLSSACARAVVRRAIGRVAGRSGGGRRLAEPPGPALRLRGLRPIRTPTAVPAPGCGCGSPGDCGTGSSSSGCDTQRARRHPRAAAQGRLGRTGADRRGRGVDPRRSPTITRAASPTCCGWPCRLGTRPPKRPSGRSGPDRPVEPNTEPDRSGPLAAYPTVPGCCDALARRAEPARVLAGDSGCTTPAATGPGSRRGGARGRRDCGRGAVLVVPDQHDLDRLRAACWRVPRAGAASSR